MNREEFKEKATEVRGKIEDGIVKAYNWTQKHPIMASIGGTLIGAAVGGLVSYKLGEAKGDREARTEIGRNILDGTERISLKCVENGSFYNDKLLDAHDIVAEKIDVRRQNLLTGAAAMHLDNGYGAYVFKDSDTSLEVYPIEEPDVAVMLAKDIQRDYVDVMNEE
jgi:hypothetical protein